MSTSPSVPVVRLWLTVLCGYVALGATQQAVPPFVVERFHSGTFLAGTAVGIAYLATACTRPFAGRTADRGYSRPVVTLGGVLGVLGSAGQWWSPNITVLLIARLIMGAGEAALLSAAMPWVLAGAPPERRGRVAGWFGLSMWAGLTIGPALASLIAGRSEFSRVWLLALLLSLLAAALVLTTRSQSQAADPSAFTRSWRTLIPRGASLPGLAFGLSSYGYGTIMALVVLYIRHDGIAGDRIALALFGLGFLVTRLTGSPLVDRFGGVTVATGSLVVEAAGLLTLSVIPTTAAALIGTMLTGVGVALMYPATVAMTLHRTEALSTGTSVGVMTSYWDLGILVAGPLGGFLVSIVGYPVAFSVAAACSAASAGVILALLRPTVSTNRAETKLSEYNARVNR